MPFEVPHGLSVPLQLCLPPFPSTPTAPTTLAFQSLIFAIPRLDTATRLLMFLLSSTSCPHSFFMEFLLHIFSGLDSISTSLRNPSLASLTWTNYPCLGSHSPMHLLHSFYQHSHFYICKLHDRKSCVCFYS